MRTQPPSRGNGSSKRRHWNAVSQVGDHRTRGREGGVAPGGHPSRQPGFMETVSAGDCTQHVGHLPAGDTPQEVMGQEAWAVTQVSVDESEGRGDVQDKISPWVSLQGPRYLAESYSGVSGAVSI